MTKIDFTDDEIQYILEMVDVVIDKYAPFDKDEEKWILSIRDKAKDGLMK